MASMTPRDKVDRACLWVRDNPKLFRRLMRLAHIEAERGNTCFQRNNIYDAARRCGFAITDSRELRRDHNLYSVLARYMVMLRPKLARCINFRKSDVDDVDLVERWHELVNPQTTFLAETWREAKKYILDALVVSGVIGNDNWRWIAGNLPDTYKVNKQEPRVIVTIEGEPR